MEVMISNAAKSIPEHGSNHDQDKEVKAIFDASKAGVKGLVDPGVTKIPPPSTECAEVNIRDSQYQPSEKRMHGKGIFAVTFIGLVLNQTWRFTVHTPNHTDGSHGPVVVRRVVCLARSFDEVVTTSTSMGVFPPITKGFSFTRPGQRVLSLMCSRKEVAVDSSVPGESTLVIGPSISMGPGSVPHLVGNIFRGCSTSWNGDGEEAVRELAFLLIGDVSSIGWQCKERDASIYGCKYSSLLIFLDFIVFAMFFT
ncbi:unnamed protein product [Dovyalis caffra]|uniref:Uncharacterized protein n=1 Tax=Dovyalis caffra TaxID=77055 RepID=A0AAV1RQF9_9ROSI|nr:unnamed protein product [Dovyalis caffra]